LHFLSSETGANRKVFVVGRFVLKTNREERRKSNPHLGTLKTLWNSLASN